MLPYYRKVLFVVCGALCNQPVGFHLMVGAEVTGISRHHSKSSSSDFLLFTSSSGRAENNTFNFPCALMGSRNSLVTSQLEHAVFTGTAVKAVHRYEIFSRNWTQTEKLHIYLETRSSQIRQISGKFCI